ncbi:hypothetical protein BDV93DRAFT_560873 [Ceratobasidium sp. AG-I]|nr:hypothetical protein BDV93DRAFT_560873 [Ceratobasidium sp. AG-I]
MANSQSQFFDKLNEPLSFEKKVKEKRLIQRRPFFRNPFSETEQEPLESYPSDDELDDEPGVKHQEVKLSNPGPDWVHLFYDLAWTATFSSLTQNGDLTGFWNLLSYTGFFIIVWWMWVSQLQYSLHYYTNDWFHLGSIFIQLVIFGMLASTTHSFDVTNYILHSPGMVYLDPMRTDDIYDPDRYSAQRTASLSMKVIAISLAISRVILLIQYLRIVQCARQAAAERGKQIPWRRISVIPVGLAVATALFFGAYGITRSAYGKTNNGAKIKFILWPAGLIIEIASHIRMSRLGLDPASLSGGIVYKQVAPEDNQLEIPYSGLKTRERLEAITTIILGEGINGIAGTLYSIITAPGLTGPIVANIACAAVTIYFLAYLYFEGSTTYREMKEGNPRQVYWVILHFPLLLFIILLLQGMKNQFALMSFLSSSKSSFEELNIMFKNTRLSNSSVVENIEFKNYFRRRGLTWADEYRSFVDTLTQNGTTPAGSGGLSAVQKAFFGAWEQRISLKIMVNSYKLVLDSGEDISSNVTNWIQQYNTDLTQPDAKGDVNSPQDLYYYQILDAMLDSKLQTTRYIMALAGLVLICMAVLDFIHARPKDRYHWASILSRFSMGCALVLLLLLNIGQYQSIWAAPDQIAQQAGVYRWLVAYWVLPTIAIAFTVQFLIDIALVRLAVLKYEFADNPIPSSRGAKLWLYVKDKIPGRSVGSGT